MVEAFNIGLAFAIIAAGALSIFYIFVGGISFILSGGEDAKVKKAVQTIRYAVVGLVITVFAVTFVSIIGGIFNVPLTKYIQWNNMSQIISDIIDRAVSTSSTLDNGGLDNTLN